MGLIKFNLQDLNPKNYILVHIISSQGKMMRYDPPLVTSEIQCPNCGAFDSGITCLVDPKSGTDVMWFCSKLGCIKTNKNSLATPPKKFERAQEWIDVCKRFNIGDKMYTVRFEDLKRNEATIQKMRNFAQKPSETGLFKGHKGSGKTWACLAILELYTRFSVDCHFTTADSLQDEWISCDNKLILKHKLKETAFLIIDDFSQSPPPDGFMSFIFDLVNHRGQWSNKGTIFTTNADTKLLLQYCGAALADRLINASFNFNFAEEGEKSRRSRK